MFSRRTVMAGIAAAPLSTLSIKPLFAAGFPERPIHLIVPFAAGGNADIVGRIAGNVLGQGLGGTVVIEDRAGAGGSLGAEYVAHAAPDGYSLLVGSNGPLTVNPFVQAHLGYDPLKDFAAVGLTSYVPHALIMSNKVAAKTLGDVIAASKKTPLNIATSGVGSASHMTLARLNATTGANFTHVPYRGGAPLQARAGYSDLRRRRREGLHGTELYRHRRTGQNAARRRRATAGGARQGLGSGLARGRTHRLPRQRAGNAGANDIQRLRRVHPHRLRSHAPGRASRRHQTGMTAA